MATSAALRQFQAGIQSAWGTAVAATAGLAIEEFEVTPAGAVHRPRIARALTVANPGDEFVTQNAINWTARGPFVWDQFQFWLSMLVEGDVSASGGSAPFTWDHTADPTTVPVGEFVTFERRRTDGSNNVDEEWPDCFAQTLRLSSAGADGRVDMEVSGQGNKTASSTLTGSLSLPTVQGLPMALTGVFIDAAWGSLGGTAIAAQVLDWSFLFNSGFFGVRTADGKDNLDFTAMGFNARARDLEAELTVRVAGQMATEKAAAAAQSLRAVRLAFEGPSSRALNVNFLAKHATEDVITLGEQDGEDIVRLRLVGATDGTNFVNFDLDNTTDEVLGWAAA